MVWVHGGSLRTGESDDYNPAGLVRDGVVVVTINYRLGALGFLADAALASRPGGAAGNYGLMDQQAALRWVQRNIGGFGGDPGEVTLFGESAGGLSTLAQLVSPGARGLFQRAIVESGTYQLTSSRSPRPKRPARPSPPRPAAPAPRRPACAVFPSRRSWPTRTRPATPRTSTAPCSPSRSRPRWPAASSITCRWSSHQPRRVPAVRGGDPAPRRRVTAANYQTMIASTLGVSAAIAGAIAAQYPLSRYPARRSRSAPSAPTRSSPATRSPPSSRWPGTCRPLRTSSTTRTLRSSSCPRPVSLTARRTRPSCRTCSARPPSRTGRLLRGPAAAGGGHEAGLDNLAKTGIPAAGWPRFAGTSQRMLSLVPPAPQVETDFAAQHHCAFWSPEP